MDRNIAEVGWTDEQWNSVNQAVMDEAARARVAAKFLPPDGPIDASEVAVPDLLLNYQPSPVAPPPDRVWIDSLRGTVLTTISVRAFLQTHEVADPELRAGLSIFRRAANIIARAEDALVFNGQPGPGLPPLAGVGGLPAIFQFTGGVPAAGLLPPVLPLVPPGPMAPRVGLAVAQPAFLGLAAAGPLIVGNIVAAINMLEGTGHFGPFACVLAPDLYEAICEPAIALVLPRDRILPFLDGGPLLRSSAIPNGYGLLVALAGSGIEIVTSGDVRLRFLQITAEPRFLFRVSERIALRVKEWDSFVVLHP